MASKLKVCELNTKSEKLFLIHIQEHKELIIRIFPFVLNLPTRLIK